MALHNAIDGWGVPYGALDKERAEPDDSATRTANPAGAVVFWPGKAR